MSVFTNPATRSAAGAAEYTKAVLGLLGDTDPMQVLAETSAALRRTVAGLSAEEVSRPEAPGKWSIRQVLGHLADSELVWGYRLRLVLAQDRPPLTGYDQDRWAERLRYDETDLNRSLQTFTVLREDNLRLLSRASRADLERVGLHAERGEESVAHMIRLCAGHDLLHLRQLDRLRRALGERV